MNKLYIFDFDGMLVDTIHDSIACLNQTLKEFGKPTFDEDLDSFVYEDLRQFLRDNSSSKDTPVYPRYIELCNQSDFSTTKAYDGMIEVLQELDNRDITLAICSNREQNVLEEFSERFLPGIGFKYISGFRKGVPDKPDPFRLNEIIEKEGIDKENVLYFGDKDVDIIAARNAGVKMVMATYGQGNEMDYRDSYIFKLIDDPKDILDIEF